MTATKNGLFGQNLNYPDIDAKERLDRLVGLDTYKDRISRMLGILIDTGSLSRWADVHYKSTPKIIDSVARRPPLIVLAGDVGSGKTELAETIGDKVSRQHKIDITLYPLSLSARGQGRVGEMTQLLSSAFDQVATHAEQLKSPDGAAQGGVILLVDEADALAQSRESGQMHHEDRAGVNAFIRGIDQIAKKALPAAVIMCTNRLNALDPAVRRRAADILEFHRPTSEQRLAVLAPLLSEVGFSSSDVQSLVMATGECDGRDYGFTYSDLTQRLIPTLVLSAYPDNRIDPSQCIAIANKMSPTPPFQDRWSR